MPQTEGPMKAWHQTAYQNSELQNLREEVKYLRDMHNKLVRVLSKDMMALVETLTPDA
jgi:hypothetical protein